MNIKELQAYLKSQNINLSQAKILDVLKSNGVLMSGLTEDSVDLAMFSVVENKQSALRKIEPKSIVRNTENDLCLETPDTDTTTQQTEQQNLMLNEVNNYIDFVSSNNVELAAQIPLAIQAATAIKLQERGEEIANNWQHMQTNVINMVIPKYERKF